MRRQLWILSLIFLNLTARAENPNSSKLLPGSSLFTAFNAGEFSISVGDKDVSIKDAGQAFVAQKSDLGYKCDLTSSSTSDSVKLQHGSVWLNTEPPVPSSSRDENTGKVTLKIVVKLRKLNDPDRNKFLTLTCTSRKVESVLYGKNLPEHFTGLKSPDAIKKQEAEDVIQAENDCFDKGGDVHWGGDKDGRPRDRVAGKDKNYYQCVVNGDTAAFESLTNDFAKSGLNLEVRTQRRYIEGPFVDAPAPTASAAARAKKAR